MVKILLSPLRLAVGWGYSPRLLGPIAIAMLVLLRVTIGFHFLTEGVDKYRAGDWSAKPFFANAKGPFAGEFRKLVWDHDGEIRLDRDRMMILWASYRNNIAEHFGFDEGQIRDAQVNYSKAVEQYDYVMELNANEIEEFELGIRAIGKLDADPVRNGVDSLGGQRESTRRELAQKADPVFNQIDKIWDNYEVAQNGVATDEQLAAHPAYKLIRPRTEMMDTSIIDMIVPFFDMILGWCLILGLFTPIASLAAAAFLGSVFLSQYPPATGPGSSQYQLIEGMACLVLASTGAGRFAGLDFFLHLFIRKFAGPSANASGAF